MSIATPAPLARLPDGERRFFFFFFLFFFSSASSPGTSWAVVFAQPFHDYWYLFWLAAIVYLPVVVFTRRFMASRPPFSLKPLLVLWNGGLALLSMAMLAACVPYCWRLWSSTPLEQSICMNRHYGLDYGVSWAFAWMGYSKVLELFDTVLLALRKKPIILLHWYHHLTVLLFVWFSQVAATTNAHIVYTLMNCFVHSLMYSYYAFAAMGIFFPFPQVLTFLQIVQMVVGAIVAYRSGSCPENTGLYWAGVAMYTSYFVLFLHFFLEKYLPKSASSSKQSLSSKQPNRNGAK